MSLQFEESKWCPGCEQVHHVSLFKKRGSKLCKTCRDEADKKAKRELRKTEKALNRLSPLREALKLSVDKGRAFELALHSKKQGDKAKAAQWWGLYYRAQKRIDELTKPLELELMEAPE